MIRIDEIYNNTFWPWIRDNRPEVRVFFCDPPGVTTPDALKNYGWDDIPETNYVFFHDQEPVHIDLFQPLFQAAKYANGDIPLRYTDIPGHVVVSERGEFVDELHRIYRWKPHYYFYHGWACQDWFRGYDRTFLIARARDRRPTRTFMSPNRIVGGKRDHRVLFLYNVFKQGLDTNWTSVPRICPQEHVDIVDIATKYNNTILDLS